MLLLMSSGGTAPLIVTSNALVFDTYQSAAQTVGISGGTQPYSIIDSPDGTVATANIINGATLQVVPAGPGSTSVVIGDSSTPQQQQTITIQDGDIAIGGFQFQAPYFGQRVPCQFICTDYPTLSISSANNNLLQNNPMIFNANAGTVAKSDPGSDGLNYLRGLTEYAPFSLDLQWKILSYSDYLKLAQLAPYYVHFISYRNLGYYGRLVLEGPKSTTPKTADILQLKGVFLPMSPSDQGGAQTINRVSAPASVSVAPSGVAATGNISKNVANFYWLTFWSKYGETTPVAAPSNASGGYIDTTHDQTKNTISWSWPTNTQYCEVASLYVASVNDPTQARLVGEVPNGLTSTWVDYVGYQGTLVNRQPATTNTAYRGQWNGGIWFNETP